MRREGRREARVPGVSSWAAREGAAARRLKTMAMTSPNSMNSMRAMRGVAWIGAGWKEGVAAFPSLPRLLYNPFRPFIDGVGRPKCVRMSSFGAVSRTEPVLWRQRFARNGKGQWCSRSLF